ncbi:hypothetical protein EGW08_011691, partial [Elysia chlorotica]
NDSLFSLELVVEKLYIPHTPCRFPAVAFRLLDFPTILIKHVEDDLGTAIRNKISFDPYYTLPDQFSELKDKHGNFMVRKGKSCLFKIRAELLKQHLASTPLYVMVIDMFPEVPKLIGNSTVPLDAVIDSICMDIVKMGPTVPSVHGDKGLFKIYNLMGKEIGYFVLGFRMLCFGPSLIPHLPESTLMQRQSKGGRKKVERSVEKMLDCSMKNVSDGENEPEVILRNSASMTDPVKHDVLLQTVDLEDKAIHVVMSGVDIETNTNFVEKESHTTATQTEKRKSLKDTMNSQKKWLHFEQTDHKEDENDIIMSNIVCPPPLFYNCDASPKVEIQRMQNLPAFSNEECYLEDLSDIDSFDGEGIKEHVVYKSSENQIHSEAPTPSLSGGKYVPQSRQREHVRGMDVAPQSDMVFPLLTALINELACVQNPQFLLDVSKKIQGNTVPAQSSTDLRKPVEKTDNISPHVVSAVAAALVKKSNNLKDKTTNIEPSVAVKQQNSPKAKAHSETDLKDKVTKQVPAQANKTKLVYKLTTTQRLRLQKTNPKWLEKAEGKATRIITKKEELQPEASDIDATNFSDTLTEVRRLAEMELNSTAGGNTLQYIASEAESRKSTLSHNTFERPRHRRRNSRSRSIEVHLPSVKSHVHDDSGSGTITDAEDSHPEEEAENDVVGSASDEDVDIPLPDGSAADKPQVQVLNFPRYISREDSLPETIAGAANASLNVSGTFNEDSPLESTRHSHNMLGPERSNSQIQHSTDLDTRQFQSTDEPELQDLASEMDNHSQGAGGRRSLTETGGIAGKFPVINPQLSENSPVPSVRRSTSKLDPVVTPRNKLTPRSVNGSPNRPTPRPRRPLRESIHTDSLSSYMPSDPE